MPSSWEACSTISTLRNISSPDSSLAHYHCLCFSHIAFFKETTAFRLTNYLHSVNSQITVQVTTDDEAASSLRPRRSSTGWYFDYPMFCYRIWPRLDHAIHAHPTSPTASYKHSLRCHNHKLPECTFSQPRSKKTKLTGQVVDCRWIMVENVDDNKPVTVSKTQKLINVMLIQIGCLHCENYIFGPDCVSCGMHV